MNPASSTASGRTIRRERLAIDALGLGACIAIVAAGYFLGLAPLLHYQTNVMARHHLLAGQRQKVVSAQGSLRQLKGQLAALQSIESQDVLKPGKLVRINSRLEQITSLAAARGLEIKDVEPGMTRQESHYQVVPLRLNGTGSFRGCTGFLHDLRHSLHDMTVVGFRLSGTPQAAGAPVNFNLELCWYTAPLDASSQN